MAKEIKNERIRISGMTCVNCQTRIEKALKATKGVRSANVRYAGGYADVSYDANAVDLQGIHAAIERLDYEVLTEQAMAKEKMSNVRRLVGLVVIIAALYFLISRLTLSASLPLAEEGMSYGALFVIGILTSVHCTAMCGGINLSQSMPQTGGSVPRASALYNLGRVLSYTVIGFAVGGIGGVITLGGSFKGAVQIIAGVFMILMGCNMMGIFKRLGSLAPRMPAFISRRLNAENKKSNSPIIVGLLNGFMPCGPLQAMQIYALSTGSPVKGAVSMLLFSLGTVPLMFGLGAASSLLTRKFTKTVMTVGAVFVTVLGLMMFSQGAALSGFLPEGAPQSGAPSDETRQYGREIAENDVVDASNAPDISAENKTPDVPNAPDVSSEAAPESIQLINSTLQSGRYPRITVQAGIPVEWTINAPQGTITGCNRSMEIPEYGIQYSFTQGENVIEFMPERVGNFQYTCWMGMIRGTITVVEDSN